MYISARLAKEKKGSVMVLCLEVFIPSHQNSNLNNSPQRESFAVDLLEFEFFLILKSTDIVTRLKAYFGCSFFT